jgi:hypothetical protein
MLTASKSTPQVAVGTTARAADAVLPLAAALIAVPSLTLSLVMLSALLGLHVLPFCACAAVFLAVSGLFLTVKAMFQSARSGIVAVLAFTAIFAGSILFQSHMLDDTWDAFAYHKPYALLVEGGCNPIYQWRRFEDLCAPNPPWLMTKGFESVAGCLLSVTHAIEASKVVHSLCAFSALLLAWCFFREFLGERRNSGVWTIVLSALSTFNPVLGNELSTFLVDSDVSCTFNCLFFSLGLLVLNPMNKVAWAAAALTMIYFVNLKLSCAIYAALLLSTAGIALYHATRDQHLLRKFAVMALASSFFSLFVVGFNPYVLSINKFLARPMRMLKLHHELVQTVSHQFSPLAMQSPPRSPAEKLLLSMFWDPTSAVDWLNEEHFSSMLKRFHTISTEHANLCFEPANHDDGRMRLVSPFSLDAAKVHAYVDPYTPNVGGMGILFGPIFLIAVAVLLYQFGTALIGRNMTPQQRLCFYFAAAVMVSVLSNPILWLSRYVPQVWLIPVLAIAATLTGASINRRKEALCAIICCLLAGDLLIVEVPFWLNNFQKTEDIRKQLKAAHAYCQSEGKPLVLYQSEYFGGPPVGGMAQRLKEFGIAYVKSDRPPHRDERCFRICDQQMLLYAPAEETQ